MKLEVPSTRGSGLVCTYLSQSPGCGLGSDETYLIRILTVFLNKAERQCIQQDLGLIDVFNILHFR